MLSESYRPNLIVISEDYFGFLSERLSFTDSGTRWFNPHWDRYSRQLGCMNESCLTQNFTLTDVMNELPADKTMWLTRSSTRGGAIARVSTKWRRSCVYPSSILTGTSRRVRAAAEMLKHVPLASISTTMNVDVSPIWKSCPESIDSVEDRRRGQFKELQHCFHSDSEFWSAYEWMNGW